jgi:hypothetical protein
VCTLCVASSNFEKKNKFYAIQDTQTLEVMGVVNETLMGELVHSLGCYIFVTEIENNFDNEQVMNHSLEGIEILRLQIKLKKNYENFVIFHLCNTFDWFSVFC